MKPLVLKMKHFYKDNHLPNVSNNNESRDDHEMGSSSMSAIGDILIQNPSFHCFLQGKDLNPARAIIAEMLGTFILMFCISGIIASTKLTGGDALLEYALTAGLTIVVLIFSIGSISGAHVNPAVTIAIAAFGYFPWSRVPLYILAQILGSVLATLMGEFVYGINSDVMETQPSQGSQSAFMVELLATFIVVFVVAAVTQQSQTVGWSIVRVGYWNGHSACGLDFRACFRRITESSKVLRTSNCVKKFRQHLVISNSPSIRSSIRSPDV
ncbi:hypothetical protein ES332_D09G250300v1 [Gossypium tomentosum]|uniref:Aquaporin n=1 Tax=Gossypium tomentosum TaxID=34277 RepID=A0A5D2JMM7_GOSTO|nr:hypothetical protein ES332_D09G250300v1 [Gossypium tomentosum]